ncbi:uncharacterized protein METZ01_LOCUS251763, partial [marine metagenome]
VPRLLVGAAWCRACCSNARFYYVACDRSVREVTHRTPTLDIAVER